MAQRAAPTFVSLCIQHSSLALVYYDYTLTFASEVKYVWQRKIKFMTILYVFCRYSLVANVIYAVAITSPLDKLRYYENYAEEEIAVMQHIGSPRCSVSYVESRTYAVFGGSKLVLLIFGLAGTLVTVLATTTRLRNALSISTVGYQVLCAIFTTFRSIQALIANGDWRTQKHSLMFFIFQQGILYFIFATTFATASLILDYRTYIGSPRLMTARFVLHVRQWEEKHLNTSNYSDPQHSPVWFNNRQDENIFIRAATPEMPDLGEDPVERATRTSRVSII
ncbi:hypothetical protein BDQ12DRAFT_668417 [Crucibulum laeve]|uniref:DUF6533 domain-containing protein n=1 Tax=Crucibulum laeve TaxID=68775 RepID=A0A5C3LRZ1_9AGAR|nr:hypothetical protein BDQ12DRAFT_668417 [Crucibulum laeve]